MASFMRLLVCGGLFVAGYYLGRQSYRLEMQQDQYDMFEGPDGVPPESGPVGAEKRDAGD